MNFLRGNDIAFHINPRFSEGGKQVLVRNHKLGERWGSEERDLKGPFPFALGSPFEVSVKQRNRTLLKGSYVWHVSINKSLPDSFGDVRTVYVSAATNPIFALPFSTSKWSKEEASNHSNHADSRSLSHG